MASTRSALRALKRASSISTRRVNKTSTSLFDRSSVLEAKTAIKILSANGLLNSEKIQKQFLHTINIEHGNNFKNFLESYILKSTAKEENKDKSPEQSQSGSDAKTQQESTTNTQNDANSNTSSDTKTNTENTENKDKANEENKQQTENNTNSQNAEQPQGPYKPPFPPVQPLSPFFFALTAVVLFIYLYTFFGINDDNINEFLELSQYAGPVERSDALLKFKRYLTYDRFGVKLSRRLAHTDFVNVVIDACNAREKIVRDAAFEVLCELTKHDNLRIKAVDADVLSVIRNNLDRENMYVLFSLANISKDVKGAELIAKDKYIVQEMLMFLEYSFTPKLPASTRFMQRALLITLGRIAKKRENVDLLMKYQLRRGQLQDIVLSSGYRKDPVILHHLTLQVMPAFITNAPGEFEQLKRALEAQGIDLHRESFFTPKVVGYVHSSVLIAISAYVYATLKGFWQTRKHMPLDAEKTAWLKRAWNRSPLVALGLFAYPIIMSNILGSISNTLEMKTNNEVRAVSAGYLTAIPLIFYALKFGPYSIGPSFLRLEYHEDCPPRYWKYWEQLKFDTRVFWGIVDKSRSLEPLMPDEEPEPVVEEDNTAGLYGLIQSRADQLKQEKQKKKWF